MKNPGLTGASMRRCASLADRPSNAPFTRRKDEHMLRPVMLEEKAFDQLADQTLSSLVDAIGELDDVEADLSQGVLTVKFEDGKRFVINSHRAARQIWMAAESSAWHFDWDGSQWISTKSKDELLALVERTVGKKLGRTIKLR
jgi:CyaY protein